MVESVLDRGTSETLDLNRIHLAPSSKSEEVISLARLAKGETAHHTPRLKQDMIITGGNWFWESYQRVNEFLNLDEGWDGYDAPPPAINAIFNARNLLFSLHEDDLKPVYIVPSAEGGVGISFEVGGLRAGIECFNDGDVLGTLSAEARPIIWEISEDKSDIKDSLSKIKDFLNV